MDRMDIDPSEQDASTPSSKQDQESQEFCALLQQQKHLQSLTDHALKKTQPLIICNLTHEKVPLLAGKDLEGTQKVEQICLRALMVRAFPWTSLIEISINDVEDEDQETGKSSCSQSTPPSNSKAKSIPDSDLITVVSRFLHRNNVYFYILLLSSNNNLASRYQLFNHALKVSIEWLKHYSRSSLMFQRPN